jgi:hypothetical protein
MTCACGRPRRLSGRSAVCIVCKVGTKTLRRRAAERTKHYRAAVTRNKGIKARTKPPGPMKWQQRIVLGRAA